jgi:hypothetical protein
MGLKHHPRVVTDGLVFYVDAANTRSYSGSGLTANGLVGGIGGTLVNGVGFSSSNNGSFFFDGTNDYINLGNPTVLQGLQLNMTISCWFNRQAFTLSATLYSDYADVGGIRLTSLLRIDNNFLNYYTSAPNNGFQNVYPTTITSGVWYFVSVAVSGTLSSPIANIFLNGTFYTFNLGALNSTPFTGAIHCIGGNINIGTNEYFNGNISQVQIYNRALTQQEILQNYNATKTRYGL